MPNTVKKKNKSNILSKNSVFTIHRTTNPTLLAQHKKLAPLINTLFSPHSPFITCRALDPTNATIDPTTSTALAPGSIAMLFSASEYATYLPALSYVMPPSSINNKQTPAGVNSQTPAGVNSQTPAGVSNKTPSGVNKQTPSGVNKQTPSGVKIIAQTSEYVYLILEHPYLFLIK